MIASGFPDGDIDTGWQIEDAEGYRLDSEGNRILDSGNPATTTAALGSVSDAFPGSPTAHYPALYRSGVGGAIPVDLDSDSEDRWFFQRASFVHSGTTIDPNSNRLTANSSGRSVLIYSYPPDATQVATGNRGREALVVRVIETKEFEDHVSSSESLAIPSGTFRELHVTADGGQFAATSGDDDAAFGIGNDVSRSLEFWLRLDESPADPTSDRIAVEILDADNDRAVRFGVRSADHPANPGGLFYSVIDTAVGNAVQNLDLTDIAVTAGWHHVVISCDSSDQRLYLDGNAIGALGAPYPFPVSAGNSQSYGYSRSAAGLWLDGSIDNLRIWNIRPRCGRRARRDVRLQFRQQRALIRRQFRCAGRSRNPGHRSQGRGIRTGRHRHPPCRRKRRNRRRCPGTAGGRRPGGGRSRLDSKLDTAGLGAGFVINPISNYNASLYDRAAAVGAWGDVFPVNSHRLFTGTRELVIAYYQNPSRNETAATALHPNVAWPWFALDYDNVTFPLIGENKDKRIYIASRLGSEGVDENAADQLVFDPAVYANLSIYNQRPQRRSRLQPERGARSDRSVDQVAIDG